MLLTVHGWPPKPEYINARQLLNQLMEKYVGKLHFLLWLCEIPLAKHHTTYNNSSRSILIAISENMARIWNDPVPNIQWFLRALVAYPLKLWRHIIRGRSSLLIYGWTSFTENRQVCIHTLFCKLLYLTFRFRLF